METMAKISRLRSTLGATSSLRSLGVASTSCRPNRRAKVSVAAMRDSSILPNASSSRTSPQLGRSPAERLRYSRYIEARIAT